MKLTNNKVLGRIAIAFAIVITAAVLYVQFLAPNTLEARQRTQLESTQTQLIEAQEKVKTSQESDQVKAKKIEELNKQLKDTQDQLQAKRTADSAVAAVKPATTPKSTYQPSGDKNTWLQASGIPESDWGYVDSIVTRESGWNPNAVNKSSGACGLGQQLPCGKWAGAWNDPVAALKAINGYVHGRYGGWAQAVAFWNKNHWY